LTVAGPVQVVVTGLGAVSAAGAGVERLWAALLAGDPLDGAVPWDTEGFTCSRVARLPEGTRAQARAAAPPEAGPVTGPLLLAAAEAAHDAGDPILSGERVGLYLGTSMGGVPRWVDYHRAHLDGEAPPWGPRGTGYGAPAREAAVALGIRGPVLTVSAACCSATSALCVALDELREGRVDLALVVGADVVDRFVHAGFDLLRALTPGAMNPYAEGREGLILGDGAGALILESREHAMARGVAPRAVLAGGGLAGDANHMTGPCREGRGVERAQRMALDDAGVTADQVDVISAHATGTPYNDAMEARALQRLFGHRLPSVPAVGWKPVLGHTLAACGALEAIGLVCCLEQGIVPHTAGAGPQDPDCPFPVVRHQPLEGELCVAVSTNSAFAGNNAAVVLHTPKTTP
jgi:3-oxoacyl-(acyl-carrier-protein) synthase